ncbi:MAG: HipA domain-containing protein [Prevotellaceae bacterium]|jgi:hypothetical protein|nr:HipA domain-containing protein [Prevotellaceae bacterium]
MAKFFDISQWEEKQYFQTGGTRNKQVVEHPETMELYFFKTSLKKGKMDYKYEFWSEIIASEVGKSLGFNMLVYDIAYRQAEIGCLSRLMIDTNKEKLNEGINYLRGYNPQYDPEDKSRYNEYTFSFIQKTLEYYDIRNMIEDIIRVIIFDSLIGNSDRHQENWGFIASNQDEYASQQEKQNIIFSPIYDNGSCLGREIENEKVHKILHDSNMLNAYINRGKAEIRWNGVALNHFKLIEKIKIEYDIFVTHEINRIIERYNEQTIKNIVTEVDSNLPKTLNQHKLPDERKELIIKMLFLRLEKLKNTVKWMQ